MDSCETRRHQRDKTLLWCRRDRATTGADQTPGLCPVTLSQRAASCWPLAGLRGGVVVRSLDCVWSSAIAGVQGAGECSRLSSPIPGPRGSRGHTCRTLPRAGSVSASRSGFDGSFAHGRVNSDRAVDCPCSRLIRPQGPHPRTAAWRACPRKSHAVGCCWLTDTQWTASSMAGRFRRLGCSVKVTLAGK